MRRLIALLATFVGLAAFVPTGTAGECEDADRALEIAVANLVDRVGDEFFSATTGFLKVEWDTVYKKYLVWFEFKLEGKPWADRTVVVLVDSSGVSDDGSVSWYPDLREQRTVCVYCISPSDAKRLAHQAGLTLGKNGLTAELKRMSDLKRPVWYVKNRTYDTKGKVPTLYYREDGTREKTEIVGWGGNVVLIDPHNGEMLGRRSYHTQ
jgi:hypothetical protein